MSEALEVKWVPMQDPKFGSYVQAQATQKSPGSANPERFLLSIDQSSLNPETKETVSDLFAGFWADTINLFHKGGVITSLGKLQVGLAKMHINRPFRKLLNKEKVVSGTPRHYRELGINLPKEAIEKNNIIITLVNPHTDESLGGRFAPQVVMGDKGNHIRRDMHYLTTALQRHFTESFSQAELPQLIAAKSAVDLMLLDISETRGIKITGMEPYIPEMLLVNLLAEKYNII